MPPNTTIVQMQTTALSQKCAEQTQRFFSQKEYDDKYCFELFRRAIVQRADDAWEHVFTVFRALATGWVQGHSLFGACDEDVEYFVNEAFFRMARACTPEKFPRFGRVAQLLSYLKACVHGAVTDHYERKVAPYPKALVIDEIAGEPVAQSIQAQVLSQEERVELWQALQARLNGDKELIVLESYYLMGLKPREIYSAYDDVFADQQEVYQVKGNLLRRLRRDAEFREILHQHD